MTRPRFCVALTPEGTVRMRGGFALVGTALALKGTMEPCDEIVSAQLVLPTAKAGKGLRVRRMTRSGGERIPPAVLREVHERDRGCRAAVLLPSAGPCWGPLDPHHIVKRSAGGASSVDNLILLCRRHHDDTDRAFEAGRIIVYPLMAGSSHHSLLLVIKPDKWAPDPVAL